MATKSYVPVDDVEAIEDYLDSLEKDFDTEQAEENAEPGQAREPMDDRDLESIVGGVIQDAGR